MKQLVPAQRDSLSASIEVKRWELKKFDVDPETGEKTLAEVMIGGDHRETKTYAEERLLEYENDN